MGEINDADVTIELQSIAANQDQNFNNIENMATNMQKKNAFSNTLSAVLGDLSAQNWNHPSGQGWPLIDWNKVDGLDKFFDNQNSWIIRNQVIADTSEELAKLQFAGSAISQQDLLGSEWFESWLFDKALAPDDNIKRLLFWYGEDFGTDLEAEPKGGVRVIDWALWKQNFITANDLGKAILLKNLTVLASRVDGWKEAADIHMLVFNGNSDALKAIALVKGDKNLGTNVIGKWKEIASDSSNEKLKKIAGEVLKIHEIKIEAP